MTQAYKDKNLSEEKIKGLEEMGFDWTLKSRKTGQKIKTNWEKRFEELVEFKSKHGNLNVPDANKANPLLDGWASKFLHPWNA